jgi:hypothetical protein
MEKRTSISQQINERKKKKKKLRSTRCPGHTGKRSYKKKWSYLLVD